MVNNSPLHFSSPHNILLNPIIIGIVLLSAAAVPAEIFANYAFAATSGKVVTNDKKASGDQ